MSIGLLVHEVINRSEWVNAALKAGKEYKEGVSLALLRFGYIPSSIKPFYFSRIRRAI